MKRLIFLLLFLFSSLAHSQLVSNYSNTCCLNNPKSVDLTSTDGESKLSFCFDGEDNFIVITQRFTFSNRQQSYKIKIKDNSPLILVDDNQKVLKSRLKRLEYFRFDYDLDYLQCNYFYPISKFSLNSLLLNPINFIYLYRDDRVEMFELDYKNQIELYELVKDFYIYKDWKLKLD